MRNLQITQSITYRNQSIELYFNEIGKEGLISAQEEVILTRKIREGDYAALEKLTKANLRFVVSVAKKYQFQGLPLSDLISEGNLGLLYAAKKFDETRGFKFISFAVWWIRQSIMSAIAENARLIRLPTNKINEITKINKAIASVEQETLREPTDEQIAAYLETTTEKVKDALSCAPWTSSYDASLGDDEYALLDKLPMEDADSDRAIMAESFKTEIDDLLSHLSERERNIIKMTYGIESDLEMSPGDISRHVDLTTERVRQIRNIALEKLRHAAVSSNLPTLI